MLASPFRTEGRCQGALESQALSSIALKSTAGCTASLQDRSNAPMYFSGSVIPTETQVARLHHWPVGHTERAAGV